MAVNTDHRADARTAAPSTGTAETIKLRGAALTTKVQALIHEGNTHRIVVKNDDGHPIIEIPVTAGVLAAVMAPALAAVAAIAAIAADWTIEVHRGDGVATPAPKPGHPE